MPIHSFHRKKPHPRASGVAAVPLVHFTLARDNDRRRLPLKLLRTIRTDAPGRTLRRLSPRSLSASGGRSLSGAERASTPPDLSMSIINDRRGRVKHIDDNFLCGTVRPGHDHFAGENAGAGGAPATAAFMAGRRIVTRIYRKMTTLLCFARIH